MKRYWLPMGICLLVASCSRAVPPENGNVGSALDAEMIARNNRGVGTMGQFQYGAARDIFEALAREYPEEPTLAVNLAIATLNRQQDGDDQTALEILDQVLTVHPEHIDAHYVSGLLLVYVGREEEAMNRFQKVLELDPDDIYARYHSGQILLGRKEAEKAARYFSEAAKQDPYFRSAYYGGFRALQQAGKRDEAREMLTVFQKLNHNPRAHVFEFKYTKMGPRAEARTLGLEYPAAGKKPDGLLFNPAGAPVWRPERNLAAETSVSVCDVNGDGLLDLFIAVAGVETDSPNLLFWGNEDGQFTRAEAHPLLAIPQVRGALWGDIDNNGLVDVYLLRNGPNQLWQQTQPEIWTDVTEVSKTGNGNWESVHGALFDADHDGDLDIFVVNGNGPNELLNNNRDGSFRNLAADQGLQGDNTPSKAITVADLDGDRDADFIVFNQSPPHEVYLNDRLWNYQRSDAFADFEAQPALTGLAHDLDSDGAMDILTLSAEGSLVRWAARDGAWVPQRYQVEVNSQQLFPGSQLGVMDLTGDGAMEVIFSHRKGWSVVSLADEVRPWFTHQLIAGELVAIQPIVRRAERGPAMLELSSEKGLLLHEAGEGRYPFLGLTFSGREDDGAGMRSNASGIGTEVAARTGKRWTMTHALPAMSGRGQSLQPLSFGLAGAANLDFLAVEWSDGVFQSEMGLASGSLHAITETQRQLASCPVLFAWDGQAYQFVSDVLGVGGLGFAVGKGIYSTPRPWEHFLFPAGSLAPKDRTYQIKIGEPMEEVCYLDAARLVQYRLPPGWSMAVDERMHVEGPEPSGKPLYYRRSLVPTNAVNERGQKVTESVRAADFSAAPVGPLDPRFLGVLTQDHVLTLTFSEALKGSGKDKPFLLVDGWVEYPYSQTMFAAWQAGVTYRAPVLEALDPRGFWVEVANPLGYPAGMPRTMAVPLAGLPVGTVSLRLRTNLQVYWDRVAVAFEEPCPQVEKINLTLAEAVLQPVGFPKRITRPQYRPDYDYSQRNPFWDTRQMSGHYSEFGSVSPLLQDADEAVAIFGPGEEVHLSFTAVEGMVLGPQDRFVLEVEGWCKDMDLYTRDGDTVGPLPSRGVPGKDRKTLHQTFNTRFR